MSLLSRTAAARTLGALSVAVIGVLVTGQGAFAASKTVTDTTGDTYTISNQTPTRTGGAVADIAWVKTAHKSKSVVVTVRALDLGSEVNAEIVEVKGNKGKPFYVIGVAGPGVKNVILARDLSGKHKVKCSGLRESFSGKTNIVKTTVPRSCVGNPRWVRTGVMLEATTFDAVAGDGSGDFTMDVSGLDDLDGYLRLGTSLPLGPKVKRG